jgi:hypothetical protein
MIPTLFFSTLAAICLLQIARRVGSAARAMLMVLALVFAYIAAKAAFTLLFFVTTPGHLTF